jgi:amidase/aspartyl-tRNA(Asn)/glutamyl-tRNA(Gln) amidotransferase subunit A
MARERKISIERLAALSLAELQQGYRDGALSPVAVTAAMLDHAERVNPTLHALYGLRREEALAEAAQAAARIAAGTPLSPFDGVPVTIKDSVHAVGMRWHHGSALHGEGIVGRVDALPTRRLKAAGAVILGKATMPDFGLSGSGVSGSHGIVRNPWGTAWNTGGSSAGGGASLAAGIGMMSVGSDIAGSVRLPAAHCGLAALKPTQGVIPHAPASTVRSAGPIARRAADLLAWTRLLSGPDELDRHSLPLLGEAPGAEWLGTVTVGHSADFGFGPEVEPAVLACLDDARTALGRIAGRLVPVEARFGFDAYLPIDDSLKLRGWHEYAAADAAHRKLAPQELVDWFSEAADWSPARLKQIEDGIERGVAGCLALMQGIDFLLTPVMPVVNFPAEARGIQPGMPLRHSTFTAPFNQSGQPAVSLLGGFDARGLPIGLQLVGRRFDDVRLLALAAALEAELDALRRAGRAWPIAPIVTHQQETT